VTNPAVLVHKAYKPTPQPRQSRAGVNRLSPLTQALDLKDQAYIDALSPDTPVHVKAALVRAWSDRPVNSTRFLLALPLLSVTAGTLIAQSDWDEPFPPHRIADNLYYVGFTSGTSGYSGRR